MSEPLSSKLKITINGITWEKPGDLIYYNPQMVSMKDLQGNSNKRYGPIAGGTRIKVGGTAVYNSYIVTWYIQCTCKCVMAKVRIQVFIILFGFWITIDSQIYCLSLQITGPDLKYLTSTTMNLFFTNSDRTLPLGCKM